MPRERAEIHTWGRVRAPAERVRQRSVAHPLFGAAVPLQTDTEHSSHSHRAHRNQIRPARLTQLDSAPAACRHVTVDAEGREGTAAAVRIKNGADGEERTEGEEAIEGAVETVVLKAEVDM